jgi:hypothetical protein
MGEKLRPCRHSHQDMTSTSLRIAGRWGGAYFNKPRCLVITLLFNTVNRWGNRPDFGQLYWRLQCCRSLSRVKSRLPQHRKQWRTPFPRFQRATKSSPCIRQRTVGIPTQYIDMPSNPRTVLTSHVTLFSLMHICSCSSVSSCSWHAQPLSAHPPHRPYSFLT